MMSLETLWGLAMDPQNQAVMLATIATKLDSHLVADELANSQIDKTTTAILQGLSDLTKKIDDSTRRLHERIEEKSEDAMLAAAAANAHAQSAHDAIKTEKIKVLTLAITYLGTIGAWLGLAKGH